MPTYEYRCGACEREFEVRQRMSDPDLVTCEACGADKLERLISWTSVRSTSWQGALSSANPRAAMQGMHAVDRSRPQRFTGDVAEAAAPAAESTASEAGAEAAASDASDAPAAPDAPDENA